MEGVKIKIMRTAIDRHSNIGENRKQMSLEEAIFCTLHLELRVNEAKLGGIFNEGFTHRKTTKLVDEYVENMHTKQTQCNEDSFEEKCKLSHMSWL